MLPFLNFAKLTFIACRKLHKPQKHCSRDHFSFKNMWTVLTEFESSCYTVLNVIHLNIKSMPRADRQHMFFELKLFELHKKRNKYINKAHSYVLTLFIPHKLQSHALSPPHFFTFIVWVHVMIGWLPQTQWPAVLYEQNYRDQNLLSCPDLLFLKLSLCSGKQCKAFQWLIKLVQFMWKWCDAWQVRKVVKQTDDSDHEM